MSPQPLQPLGTPSRTPGPHGIVPAGAIVPADGLRATAARCAGKAQRGPAAAPGREGLVPSAASCPPDTPPRDCAAAPAPSARAAIPHGLQNRITNAPPLRQSIMTIKTIATIVFSHPKDFKFQLTKVRSM